MTDAGASNSSSIENSPVLRLGFCFVNGHSETTSPREFFAAGCALLAAFPNQEQGSCPGWLVDVVLDAAKANAIGDDKNVRNSF